MAASMEEDGMDCMEASFGEDKDTAFVFDGWIFASTSCGNASQMLRQRTSNANDARQPIRPLVFIL
jgi:hypothetical protein